MGKSFGTFVSKQKLRQEFINGSTIVREMTVLISKTPKVLFPFFCDNDQRALISTKTSQHTFLRCFKAVRPHSNDQLRRALTHY